MSITRLVHRAGTTSQSTLLLLLPHGGQNLARRNAWASMSLDAGRARARREAAAAMTHAVAAHTASSQAIAVSS
jgi:hypothetical protein